MKLKKNKLIMLIVAIFSFVSIGYAGASASCKMVNKLYCSKCSGYMGALFTTLPNHCTETRPKEIMDPDTGQVHIIYVLYYVSDIHINIGVGTHSTCPEGN